ncbi:ABC transporter substrate-binding protein [Nocardioides marmoribigeumensis]|uniref:Glycine betaine/proline transport system substrate-binding protein n=1 Tax=Nocardioides marmoribigeumensis TaxID=433649 RepID=A0ABU2BQB0_9ACTN|nr:ABC transporter substrate-binding protein [Nocardioides marmoribigeumensis]MDR7360827.1 glycine betaine/proline transport system substrate-binding protein [Nocardioides marmoribigeumensis]
MGLAAVLVSAALALTACGSGSVGEQTKKNEAQQNAAGGKCGDLKIIVNNWVGYTADAYVLGNVAKDKLGCNVSYVELKEGGPSYQALASGDGDVILEEWSHAAELEQATAKGTAKEIDPLGVVGIIGWYVPDWLAKAHPDILDWKNLNKYADKFKTSESGDKGQFLGADPNYTQYDEAIVKNLGLNFKVVFSGGETASVAAFEKAQQKKQWLIGYFYEPQYLHAVVKLDRVKLPPYKEGCDKDKAKVACDYAETTIKKVASTKFMDSDSTAPDLVNNFKISNDEQNLIAKYITIDKMTPDAAAQKWIADNGDKVDSWLQG